MFLHGKGGGPDTQKMAYRSDQEKVETLNNPDKYYGSIHKKDFIRKKDMKSKMVSYLKTTSF